MPIPGSVKHLHFIGIGGYGMSALAYIMLKKGYTVSGSDLKQSKLTAGLSELGAAVKIGHNAANISGADLVVYSTAIDEDNPELQTARSEKLPVWHRSELLAAIFNDHYGIAVAGAHGKTTTSAMVTLLLEAGGFDPTAVIGGYLSVLKGNARLGQSRYLVAEADESDGSFTRYYPKAALVTNIEPDHLEHYDHDFKRLYSAYEEFLTHLPPDGTAVLCFDDPYLPDLAERLDRPVISYSRYEELADLVDYHPRNLEVVGSGSRFDLYNRDRLCLKTVRLSVPGKHNISNAVGALALTGHLGLDLQKYAAVLEDFSGVSRRFEVIGAVNGITVIDDYAHHPTEIAATIEAAAAAAERVCCIFQPHRYTRTASLMEGFAGAFDRADRVMLHSVYSAGEQPIPGASSADLAARISACRGDAVFVSEDPVVLEAEAVNYARPGDIILVMGAGDITESAPRLVTRLAERYSRNDL